jgi:hypothetical protein
MYNQLATLTSTSIRDAYFFRAVVSGVPGYGLWEPISNFSRKDADVNLFFFAANGVYYESPVDDPFFYATIEQKAFAAGSSALLTTYKANNPIAVIGCIDQYQMCNPTNGKCTSLNGVNTTGTDMFDLDLNIAQTVTSERLDLLSVNTNTFSSVYGTGGEALKASNRVLNFLSPSLPDDQWKTEAQGWFETSLAKMQAYVVEFADVTADMNEFNSNGTVSFINTDGEFLAAWKSACANQKISNTGQYQTFSFFGIVFLVVVGCAIIFISWLLNPVMRFFTRPDNPRRLAYVADGNLQLQRMAFYGAGYQDWEEQDEEIPHPKAMRLPCPVLYASPTSAILYPQRKLNPNRGVPVPANENNPTISSNSTTPQRSMAGRTSHEENSTASSTGSAASKTTAVVSKPDNSAKAPLLERRVSYTPHDDEQLLTVPGSNSIARVTTARENIELSTW